ncbi:hypothetical protein [Chryseobacterium limigenitum]|uniref:Uncharacterized protein n=1 Tax=Chryseobacterium limigenitum TaxID=1612149 RepID=A0A1K2IX29_9FLAO|nr:hypothetical protein [Chryseobacterium limigenitum]SFZ96752.1 hypothetical protein SAMN05216324_12529 [Chryseobacterium limigenitum]
MKKTSTFLFPFLTLVNIGFAMQSYMQAMTLPYSQLNSSNITTNNPPC